MKNKWEKQQKSDLKRTIIIGIILGLVAGFASFYFTNKILNSSVIGFFTFAFIGVYTYAKAKLKKSNRIKKMEDVFPDFLSLMASNLRAGITVDRSLLLSSREEFAPLDQEILIVGKDILTGKEIDQSLEEMSKRINSERITKTINIINSGISSGGNLAVLLEETSKNVCDYKKN